MRKSTVIISFIVALLVAFGLWGYGKARSSYDEFLNSAPPALNIVIGNAKAEALIEELEYSLWASPSSSRSTLDSLFTATGFTADFEGLTAAISSHTKPRHWADLKTMHSNVMAASFRTLAIFDAVDGTFHINEENNFGVVFYDDDSANIFKETDMGVISEFIIRKSKLEEIENQFQEADGVTRPTRRALESLSQRTDELAEKLRNFEPESNEQQ